jgi:uncharacterized phage-associated protein
MGEVPYNQKTMEPIQPASAVDVAAMILKEEPGLDQMQLHKLLYFVQAASLAWFDAPAFDERIEAWTYGPVTRHVAGLYQDFGREPIEFPVGGDPSAVSGRVGWVIEQILDSYGQLPGPALARLTKTEGGPWRQTRGALPDEAPSDEVIPQSLIAEYHRHHGVLPARPSRRENHLAQRFFDGDDDALAELFEESTGVRPTIG